MTRTRALIAALGLILMGATIWGVVSYHHGPPRRQDVSLGVDAYDFAAGNRPTRTVGDAACTACHRTIAETYRLSGMSQSWRDADVAELPPGALPGVAEDPTNPLEYDIRGEGDRVVVTERRAGLDSEEGRDPIERIARYIVGSGKRACALVMDDGGYLFQMPVAWFEEGDQWRLSPGYERVNQRFDRAIPATCIACHGGRPTPTRGPDGRHREAVGHGIACERCHGPGGHHVARWRDGMLIPDEDAWDFDRTIINPARLDPARGLDVCLQCHLQGDVFLFQPDGGPFSFQPGSRLSDHRLDFLIASDVADEFGVASHGARMMQSRCFTESGGALTCTTCHDPHTPARLTGQADYNNSCLRCHAPTDCTDDPLNGVEVPHRGQCIACHMPRRETREGIHVVATDHLIRAHAQRNDGDRPSRDASAKLAPNETLELVSVWPGADRTGARLGEAYVLLHEVYGPQFPSLDRGLELLRSALSQNPEDSRAAYVQARAWIARGQTLRAIEPLERLVDADPEHHEARLRLAVALEASGLFSRADRQFERLLTDAPDWLEPYALYVRSLLRRQRAEAAEAVLDRLLARRTDAEACFSKALASVVRGRPVAESRAWLDRALSLDPRHAESRRLMRILPSE